MTTIRAFIEKIDSELQSRSLPRSVEMMSDTVSFTASKIAAEVSELVCFLLDLADEVINKSDGESTIESAADIDLGNLEESAQEVWLETLQQIDGFLEIGRSYTYQ